MPVFLLAKVSNQTVRLLSDSKAWRSWKKKRRGTYSDPRLTTCVGGVLCINPSLVVSTVSLFLGQGRLSALQKDRVGTFPTVTRLSRLMKSLGCLYGLS